MSRDIKHGSTSQSVVVRIVDATDGTPEESVVYNTAGMSMWYRREGAVKIACVPTSDLATLDAAYTSLGILHIDDGYYRFDVPDAAFASGAAGVLIGGTVTGMVMIGVYIPLVAYDSQDTVRLGLTALPNAAQSAVGGIPIKTVLTSSADNADAIHDEVVEGTLTFRQITRINLAAMAGKSTDAQTNAPKFRDQADTKNRISATTDANGNRTAMTVDGA